jgi:hypothetical protein
MGESWSKTTVSMRCFNSFDLHCFSRFEHVIENDKARVQAADRTGEREKGLQNTKRMLYPNQD